MVRSFLAEVPREILEAAEVDGAGLPTVLLRIVAPVATPGIAGFDTHAAGHHPFIGLPYHPGHEAVGVVVATVGGPRTSPPGDGVIVEPGPAR